MKIKDRAFPHPVLSPFRDDVMPNKFTATLAVHAEPEFYKLKPSLSMEHSALMAMVAEGHAAYSVHIECRNNFYRQVFQSAEPNFEISIPATELSGTVEVSFFVTASIEVAGYSLAGTHSDYGSERFSIRAGDVLAMCKSVTFEAEKEYDSLKKISSIIQIDSDEKVPQGKMEVFLDADKITVFLSKLDFANYGELKVSESVRATLIQCVSLPPLIEAISYLKTWSGPPDSQFRWMRRLRERLSKVAPAWEQSQATSLDLAQAILANPVGRCFPELLKVTE